MYIQGETSCGACVAPHVNTASTAHNKPGARRMRNVETAHWQNNLSHKPKHWIREFGDNVNAICCFYMFQRFPVCPTSKATVHQRIRALTSPSPHSIHHLPSTIYHRPSPVPLCLFFLFGKTLLGAG